MSIILPAAPTAGSSFVKGLGSGFSEALPKSIHEMISLRNEARKTKARSLEKLPQYVQSSLKNLGKEAYSKNPKFLQDINKLAEGFVDQGHSLDDAFKLAYKQADEAFKAPKKQEGSGGSFFDMFKLSGQNEPGEEQPSTRDFLADLFTKAKEAPLPGEHPMALLERESPGATAKSLLLGAAAPFEEAIRYQSEPAQEFMQQLGFTYPEGSERGQLFSEKARGKLHEGLSPKAIRAAEGAEFSGAFLPIERIFSGMKLIGKSAGFLKNAEKFAAREGISAAEATERMARQAETAGVNLEKIASGDKQEAGKLFNFSNRISKEAPKTGTELRVSRAAPEEKMFKTKEHISTRESQIRSHPRYEEEITRDAAERTKRAEKVVGPKATATMEGRIHEAQKAIPHIQDSVAKAAARVRALEDHIAKLSPDAAKQAESLLSAARKELTDSEFQLKQVLNNAKTGEARVGLEDMRKAAQKKMVGITDTVAEGGEVALKKADYNPEHIKEASKITKSKKLPATKQHDYYTQVHDEYITQYRNRLGQLESESSKLAAEKSMANVYKRQRIAKEKEVLNKLIESAEAQNTIHRHKLALRETAARHQAKQRFGELKKIEGAPKVQKVSSEKMYREKAPEIKTAEGREKLAEEIVEDTASQAKDPKIAQSIRNEKGSLKDALEEVRLKNEKIAEDLANGVSPQKAKSKADQIFNDLSKSYKKFMKDLPFLSRHGVEALTGFLTGLLDSLRKDLGAPFSTTTILASVLGAQRRAPSRILGNALAQTLVKKWKISNAADAYKKGDDEKLSGYSTSIKKEARKKAFNQ